MYSKLVILSQFLIPPKKIRDEWMEIEDAKLVFKQFFYSLRIIYLDHDCIHRKVLKVLDSIPGWYVTFSLYYLL